MTWNRKIRAVTISCIFVFVIFAILHIPISGIVATNLVGIDRGETYTELHLAPNPKTKLSAATNEAAYNQWRTSGASIPNRYFLSLIAKLMDSAIKVSKLVKPPGLEKFFNYDSSSKLAILDITRFMFRRNIPVPLFENVISPSNENGPKKRICVTITTARRQNTPLSYLAQTVAALITRMKMPISVSKVSIHVFNVDNEPEKHDDVDLVRHLVPVTRLKVRRNVRYPKQQESLDFTHLLRLLAASSCEYAILLEDDALADENWLDLVEYAISQLEERDWFVVKLYSARPEYLFPQRPRITNYDQGYNTVAMLLNKEYMTEFADALDAHMDECLTRSTNSDKCSPKDIFMEDFAAKKRLKMQAFEPVIFQHTGVYSSISKREISSRFTFDWGMESSSFQSENVPIVFDSAKWI